MSKTVTINQDKLLMLKETVASDSNIASHNDYCSELTEAAPEVDEYEIGDEGSNPPVGGNFYHVNESYNVSVRGDLDSINTIEFIPHEDAREEGYEDDEIEDFEPYYEIDAMDMDGNTILCADLTVEELFDYFPQSIINDIIEKDKSNATRLSNPSINQYRIEDILYRDTTPSDVDNVEEVNRIAKKIQTGGSSAYLLTDGDIIYFHDHIYINNIDGITPDKFIALGNIRLGNGGFELIKEPTRQQMYELKQWIRQQDSGIYVDFCEESHQTYPRTLFSTKYGSPNAERIVNDIYYYFEEGIKPQDNFYESKENDSEVIIENTFEKWFGSSILKDENGQPLKMYHGTDAEFDSFSKEHIGRTGAYEGYGFNFTPFESRARGYNSKRVIEAYLRVTNPMTTKSYNISLRQLVEVIRQLDEGKPYTDTIVAAYEPPRYGENWDKKYYMRALPSAARTIYQYNKENEYGDAGLYAEICLNGNADKFKTIETFEKLGYDSAIFYDNDDRINTVIVFEPNQIKLTSNKTFSTTSDVMGENFDFEVDSSEIDLSSFKKKHELVPNIWNPDGKLNSRIRLKLLDIADDFWEYVNLTWVKPSGIILTGSICNFNWSQYSDIDLHLIVDFDEIDEKTEFVKDYLDSKKNEWNNEHSGLQIMGYPVELYVQNLGEMPESNGIYDLEENDWIREPNPDDIKSIGLNKFSIKDKAAKIMTIIDDMYDAIASTDDSHKIEQMGDDASYLWKKVKEMRKSSLEKNGESGSGNIVYKILRRTGYLDRLFKLSNVVYDKFNSITESTNVEDIDIFGLAKERFGVTNDIRECGYVLPDGSMLDFSGRHMVTGDTDTSHLKGRRSVDHRDIGDLNWDRDMTTRTNVNINMADFIRKGAIRIHCSNTWSSINLFVKPTKEQINPLLRLIQYSKGCVTVEVGDGDNSYEYAEWDEANPRRVINDVIRYFDGETIKLVGNVRESIRKYSNAITLLKEEVVADGNSEHNPYKKRWEAERKALKDFICNFGKVMTSRENGKTYKVYYDKVLSQLIGYNYCICLQWDAVNLKPKSVLYIRALDKFTDRMFQANFDARGRDNMAGTYDDLSYQAQ